MGKITGRLFFVTFLSRTVQILSSIIIAYSFGTSREMDTYQLAFSFSEVIIGIILVALNVVFIPVYYEIVNKEGEEKAQDYFNNLFSLLIIMGLLLSIAGFFAAPLLSFILPHSKQAIQGLLRGLLIIGFVLMVPRIISGMFVNFLNATKKFIAPASMEIPLSFLFMLVIIIFKDKIGIYSLALAVGAVSFLGAVLSGVIAVKKGLKIKCSLNIKLDKNIISTAKLSLPILLASAATQININVDKVMASFLPAGSVSTLFYAKGMRDMLLSFIIVPIVVIVFPFFSQYSAEEKVEEIAKLHSHIIKLLMFLLFPATILIIILAKPLICLVYEHGSFTGISTQTTSTALILYSISLFWLGINQVISRIFYAFKKNMLIFFIGILSILSNIILNLILMRFFLYAGIALSTSIVEIIITVILLVILKKHLGSFGGEKVLPSMFKILTASLIMGGIVLCVLTMVNFTNIGFWGKVLNLLVPLISGILAYMLLSVVFNIEEYKVILRNFPLINRSSER